MLRNTKSSLWFYFFICVGSFVSVGGYGGWEGTPLNPRDCLRNHRPLYSIYVGLNFFKCYLWFKRILHPCRNGQSAKQINAKRKVETLWFCSAIWLRCRTPWILWELQNFCDETSEYSANFLDKLIFLPKIRLVPSVFFPAVFFFLTGLETLPVAL